MIVILKIGLNHLKGKETTKYGITKPSAPQLPTFRNVTKSIQILLYKAVKHPPHSSFHHALAIAKKVERTILKQKGRKGLVGKSND